MHWQLYGWTAHYVYWTYLDGNKPIYNVTISAKEPPNTEAGYYDLKSLRKLKSDTGEMILDEAFRS